MRNLIRSLAAMVVLALIAIAPSVEAFFLHFRGGAQAQIITAVTVAAAGTTQAGATQLAAETRDNITSGTGGVALSTAVQNNVIGPVCNLTSAQVLVYPINGGSNTIGPLAANKPMPLGVNVCQTFMAKSSSAWTYQEGQCGSGPPVVFSLPCYGGLGDGLTDDTAAAQAAENAAEALCCGGTVLWPSANYLISTGPIVVAKSGIEWRCLGGVSDGTSSNIPGATLINNSNATLVDATFNAGASQSAMGPQFFNCNFNQATGTSRAASTIGLHIVAFLNGGVHGGSFQNFNTGIQLDCTVNQDNSNWIFDGNIQSFNNVKSRALVGTAANCGGTFRDTGNYFNIRLQGDVGIDINGGNGTSCSITNDRVDGSTSGTPAPLNYFVHITGQATVSSCLIANNNPIEDPVALWLDWNGQAQGIRAIRYTGNLHEGTSAPAIVATCNITGPGATSLTGCSATVGSLANIVPGMCVTGLGLRQFSLTWSNNTIASNASGSTFTGVVSGTTVPITVAATTLETSQSYTFAYPALRWDYQTVDTNSLIFSSNTYTNDNNNGAGCGPWTDGQ